MRRIESEVEAKPVDAEVTWTSDAFAFKSLERYDAQGHPYIYTVEETRY